MPNHPVLIVNPRSGNGRAAAIDLFGAAHKLGLETVTMQPGDDLAELAVSIVDQGCDHLMMAGGDGSLAIVAEVAMARDVPFSCVPVGTRNHFAMDLGLDRSHPLQSLDAALDGSERLIDVGIVAGQVFLNNVSFGLYPQAIADPEYRSHRARSMADAAVDTVSHLETQITRHLARRPRRLRHRGAAHLEQPLPLHRAPRLRQTPRSRHRHAGDHPCRPPIAAATRASRIHPVGERTSSPSTPTTPKSKQELTAS